MEEEKKKSRISKWKEKRKCRMSKWRRRGRAG
jgi:hypothetical protein